MGICDALDRWSDSESGKYDRLQDLRDWVKAEAESWGMEAPPVELGKSIDENGNEHWASYDRDTDTIKMDPALFDDPDTYDAIDVFNSAAHELRHAMQDQYAEGDEDPSDDMSEDDRQQDAEDFAEAYQELWESECGDDETESVPADDAGPGDWNLPAEGVANA